MTTAEAICQTLESSEVLCYGGAAGPANVVDSIAFVSSALHKVAESITPNTSSPGRDASGGFVLSLTEAVMGTTAGLHSIADAINNLAEAVRERR